MARNQGSSMKNGSKVGHSKYRENGSEKSARKEGNKVGKLRSHISSNIFYCEIPHRKGWNKTPPAIYGPLLPIFYPIDKANTIADCLENQFRAHDVCD
jgi:hypothetical protein